MTIYSQKLNIICYLQGNRIQAGIKKEHIPKFQNKLKKGTWKVLEEFGVTKASGQYRSTKAKYRINILYTTVVTNSPPMSEKIWLDLTEFNSINSGILDPNYLVGKLFTIPCSITYV